MAKSYLHAGDAPTPSRLGANLMKTVEQQIIPRLVLAHCADSYREPAEPSAQCPLPGEAQIAELASVAAKQNVRRTFDLVDGMRQAGLSYDKVLLEFVAPAARHLGSAWFDDRCSWTDVTLGAGTLQRVVQMLSPMTMTPMVQKGLVVLTAAGGEQHTLGIHILGELLRLDGWGVHVQANISELELVGLVESESIAMIGISTSDVDRARALPALVSTLRRVSCNPDLCIVLGGTAEGLAGYAKELGVLFTNDARDAIEFLSPLEVPDARMNAR